MPAGRRLRGARHSIAHPLPVLDHLVDAAPQCLDRLDAKCLGGGRIPEANDPVGVDEEHPVVDELERFDRVRARLDFAVEECVVESDRGAAAQLDGEVEVGLGERRLRRHGAERDRAERAPACDQRDDDAGGVSQLADSASMLVVVRHLPRLGLNVGDELRLACADRALNGMSFDRGRILLAQPQHQLGLPRVDMTCPDAPQVSVLVQVHGHVPGEDRHRDVGEGANRVLVDERLVEQLAALCQKAHALLGGSRRGHVVDHADSHHDLPLRIPHRVRAHDRPALVAGGADAVADETLGGTPAESTAPRELFGRER